MRAPFAASQKRPDGRQSCSLGLGGSSAAWPPHPCRPEYACFSLGDGLIRKDKKDGTALQGDLWEK